MHIETVEKIERLIPPILEPSAILKKLACTRPMREGCFNISCETYKGIKQIIHCYGHGGSGWTTLWGSIEKVLQHLERCPRKPIRIIGAGCMGLAAAIQIARSGFPVAGITTKEQWDIPSWRAAGYFALVSLQTSPENQENLNQIGADTYKTFQLIDQGKHPYISKDVVHSMPVYCSAHTESGLEELEIQGVIPPKEIVTLDFGNGIRYPGFFKYKTYFIETANLMLQLTAEIKKLRIPLEIRELSTFDDVAEEIIINCSGLGARELNGDRNMIPVRGHIILCNERAGFGHMDYIIYTKCEQDGKEEYVYLFPKTKTVSSNEPKGVACRGLLGGTFISGCEQLTDDELARLDESEFKKMLDRHSLFFHGKLFGDI